MNGTLYIKILCLIAFCFSITSTHALKVRSNNSPNNNRFDQFPQPSAHNPDFIHKDYATTLTSAGWYPRSLGNTTIYPNVTLISPIHFIGADHYKPSIGTTISFLSSDGNLITRSVSNRTTIKNSNGINSDIFIGTFDTPILASEKVSYSPYLRITKSETTDDGELIEEIDTDAYYNQSLIALGRNMCGGISTSSRSIYDSVNATQTMLWTYNTITGNDSDCYLQAGDSGSPLFIDNNTSSETGKAAIIGVHLGVNTTASTSTFFNFSSFIPHYIDAINTVIEPEGYQLTSVKLSTEEADKTTLKLSHQLQEITVQAGHELSINLELKNAGLLTAENIKLQNTFSSEVSVTSSEGVNWIQEPEASLTNARKALLKAGTSSKYSLTLNAPTAGTLIHHVTYYADQFEPVTESFKINVIESIDVIVPIDESGDDSSSNVVVGNKDTTDKDLDGINDLLEYAFGGDPLVNSQQLPSSKRNMLPSLSGNTFSYIRRVDYIERGLSYSLMTSTSLQGDNWEGASSIIRSITTSTIDTELELVILTLDDIKSSRYFKLEVTLTE